MSAPKRAWLITHHAPAEIALNYSSITADDLIVAVDGGYERCLQLGLRPAVLIGDFDSISKEVLSAVPDDCLKIIHPTQKNETDTQLALQYCLQQGVSEVIICNDLAGRFDHSLALVQNLLQAHQNRLKASVVSSNQIVFIIAKEIHLDYTVNSVLSLLSITPTTEFLSSQGLQYSLTGITLHNWQSRGISNSITQPEQYIEILSGLALAVVTLP